MNPLLDFSLAEVLDLLRRKECSALELVDACLEQIAATDPETHAYIRIGDPEVLRSRAAYADNLIARGRPGPLQGIPIAVKDNIATRAMVTTAGSRILSHWQPGEDAEVISRLDAAGAIIIGKTNMHEFAWGGTSENPHYGTVRNPWDLSRLAAGSSGGSAVAVATRTCFGALGTDTGGSVRLPAAWNGVVGLRPTIGLVSNRGVVPLAWSLDTVGPLARTVQDCAILTQVVAGYDERDPSSVTCNVPDYSSVLRLGVDGLRIAVVTDFLGENTQATIRAALMRAQADLESLGAQVFQVAIPELERSLDAQFIIESCESSTFHQKWLRTRADEYGEDVRVLLEAGELYLATHYLQAQRYRRVLRSEFLRVLETADALLMPTVPFTAPTIGETKIRLESGREMDMLQAITTCTAAASLTGLPAMNVPCGFDDNGVPIGMQLVGKPFHEADLFRIGHAYQMATHYHIKSPSLPASHHP